MDTLVQAINQLGMKLLSQTGVAAAADKGKRTNRMISPASIGFALSMLREGASGGTSEELDQVMALDRKGQATWGDAQRQLRELLAKADSSVRLEIANTIWSRIGVQPSAAYMEKLRRDYAADCYEIDFEAEDAADQINQWVSDATHEKITRLVDAGTLSGLMMYIANAVYFKGVWAKPFQTELTAERPFFTQESGIEARIEVPTMQQNGRYAYLDAEGFQAIRLPYGANERFEMVLVLPDHKRTLAEFYVEHLPRWNEWNQRFRSARGTIELPKFKLETSLVLNDVLIGLGVKQAFDPMRADFAYMGQHANQAISRIVHKTFIEVDEVGTEAAAVTGIARAGATFVPEEPFELKLNRPFFFAITERQSGLILFMGELIDPTA